MRWGQKKWEGRVGRNEKKDDRTRKNERKMRKNERKMREKGERRSDLLFLPELYGRGNKTGKKGVTAPLAFVFYTPEKCITIYSTLLREGWREEGRRGFLKGVMVAHLKNNGRWRVFGGRVCVYSKDNNKYHRILNTVLYNMNENLSI